MLSRIPRKGHIFLCMCSMTICTIGPHIPQFCPCMFEVFAEDCLRFGELPCSNQRQAMPHCLLCCVLVS